MRHQARPLDMPQESCAKSRAFVRALDQSGQVGDDERPADVPAGHVVGRDDAQVRFERGERVVGNLGMRRRDARDQRGLPGVREAHQADVGQQLEFQPQMALFARLAFFGLARRLVPGLGEMLVAAPAPPAVRHGQRRVVPVARSARRSPVSWSMTSSSYRHLQDRVGAGMARCTVSSSPWRPRSARNSRLKR